MEKTDWSKSYSCKRLAQYLRIDELVSNLRATIFFIKSRFDQSNRALISLVLDTPVGTIAVEEYTSQPAAGSWSSMKALAVPKNFSRTNWQ